MNQKTLHLASVLEKHAASQRGKVTAVTGTTSGTGYVCARELGRLGAEVILLNRASHRAAESLEKLKSEVPEGKFVSMVCDLQDFASVRAAAAAIGDRFERLDTLCNNAGVMAMPDVATKDGYDIQMQTNVLSHFLLTKELFGLLKKSPDGRIVNHSSMARRGVPLDAAYFEQRGGDLGGDGTEQENRSYSGPRWARYHQTKLANCAFTYDLKARFEQAELTNLKALLAHPGLAATQLQVTTSQAGGMDLNSPFMKQAQSPEDGATGILRACVDPHAASGDFFGPQQWAGFPEKLEPEDYLSDPENLRIHWEGCEAAVGVFAID